MSPHEMGFGLGAVFPKMGQPDMTNNCRTLLATFGFGIWEAGFSQQAEWTARKDDMTDTAHE